MPRYTEEPNQKELKINVTKDYCDYIGIAGVTTMHVLQTFYSMIREVITINSSEIQMGDKIYFQEFKRPFTVKATNSQFTICTKPLNLQRTCIYTIIDWEQGKRNRNNMAFNPYDYMKQEDIDECLRDLTDPEHVCEISHRGPKILDVEKIVRGRKALSI